MPINLQDIEELDETHLRIRHLHFAITEEARQRKNWINAMAIFTSYLAPLVLAAQKNGSSAEAASSSSASQDAPAPSGARYNEESSLVAEVVKGDAVLTPTDVNFIQYSISTMVRYAPSPAEANVIYMFFLQQCQLPVRNDDTIDTCLISLIYQYAQAKDDPELQDKGLDLIKVALERGVGLPSYQSRKSLPKNRVQYPQKETILASVSKPILIRHQLQITEDGLALEARQPQVRQPPQRRQPPHASIAQPAQPQQAQPQQRQPLQERRQGQEQPQRTSHGVRPRNSVSTNSPQQDQPKSSSQSSTPGKDGTSNRRGGINGPVSENRGPSREKKVSRRAATAASTPAAAEQFHTFKPFQGTMGRRRDSGRDSDRGDIRGNSNGGLSMGPRRVVAFVPASTNTMSKTYYPEGDVDQAVAGAKASAAPSEDLTSDIVRGVEDMKLGDQKAQENTKEQDEAQV